MKVDAMHALLYLVLLIVGGKAIEYSKTEKIYASGYLPDCPGSTKEAIITKKSLRHLSFYVITNSTDKLLNGPYNYYQMKQLAKDPNMDFTKMTLLFVGGYLSSPLSPFITAVGEAAKKIGYNVLMLDTLFFTAMEYSLASRFTRPVGLNTAKMLVELTREGLDPKKLHVMGISLGGQTISFIGKSFRQLTGMNISRITGLDPAGPCFRNLGPEDRLYKSDADFVDVIYTNTGGSGMVTPLGHVNFYVNGGEYQPGQIFWNFCPQLCSHIRSFIIFESALQYPNNFIGMQCDSVQQARDKNCYDRVPQVTNVIGLNTDRSKEGIFYVATSQRYPFFLGKDGLKKENDFLISRLKSFDVKDKVKL